MSTYLFNISVFQTGRSFIRNLTIQNNSKERSGELMIKIFADSPFIDPFEFSLAYLPANGNVKIPTKALKINRSYLQSVSGSEQVSVTVEILEGENVANQERFQIDIQPLEHFGGFEVMPELIASYITPNHPYVYHNKRKAVEILEGKGPPAFILHFQIQNLNLLSTSQIRYTSSSLNQGLSGKDNISLDIFRLFGNSLGSL